MLRIELGHNPIDDYYSNRLGSTFDYQHTNETFGIVELPHSVIRSYNMNPSIDTITRDLSPMNTPQKLLQLSVLPASQLPVIGYSKHNFMYIYLANCQRTSIAVTAVHTPEEMLLFKNLLVERHDELFSYDDNGASSNENTDSSGGPNGTSSSNAKKKEKRKERKIPSFEVFAKIWSSYCNDSNQIFYKLSEHLQSYYNILEDRKKYGESVSMNMEVSREVRKAAQSEIRYTGSIAAIPQPNIPPPPLINLQHRLIAPPEQLPSLRNIMPLPISSYNANNSSIVPDLSRRLLPNHCGSIPGFYSTLLLNNGG
jgi:hypothetical protein